MLSCGLEFEVWRYNSNLEVRSAWITLPLPALALRVGQKAAKGVYLGNRGQPSLGPLSCSGPQTLRPQNIKEKLTHDGCHVVVVGGLLQTMKEFLVA